MAKATQATANVKAGNAKVYNGTPLMIGSAVVVMLILFLSGVLGGAGGSLSISGIFGMISARQEVLTSCHAHNILHSSVEGNEFDPRALQKCRTQESPATVVGVETCETGYNRTNFGYNFGHNNSNNNGILNKSVDSTGLDFRVINYALGLSSEGFGYGRPRISEKKTERRKPGLQQHHATAAAAAPQ